MDAALGTLRDQPFGTVLLLAMAAGFAAFGCLLLRLVPEREDLILGGPTESRADDSLRPARHPVLVCHGGGFCRGCRRRLSGCPAWDATTASDAPPSRRIRTRRGPDAARRQSGPTRSPSCSTDPGRGTDGFDPDASSGSGDRSATRVLDRDRTRPTTPRPVDARSRCDRATTGCYRPGRAPALVGRRGGSRPRRRAAREPDARRRRASVERGLAAPRPAARGLCGSTGGPRPWPPISRSSSSRRTGRSGLAPRGLAGPAESTAQRVREAGLLAVGDGSWRPLAPTADDRRRGTGDLASALRLLARIDSCRRSP